MGPLTQSGRVCGCLIPQGTQGSLVSPPRDHQNPQSLIHKAPRSNRGRPTQRHRRALYQETALGRERVVLSATYGRRERETPRAGVLFRPGNRRRKAEWFDSTSSTIATVGREINTALGRESGGDSTITRESAKRIPVRLQPLRVGRRDGLKQTTPAGIPALDERFNSSMSTAHKTTDDTMTPHCRENLLGQPSGWECVCGRAISAGEEDVQGSIVVYQPLLFCAVPWCSTANHHSLWSLLLCFPNPIAGGRESCGQGFKSPRDNWEEEERGIPHQREMQSACALIPSPRVPCNTINIQEVEQHGRSIDSSGRTAARSSRELHRRSGDACPRSRTPLWTHSSARIEHLASNSSSAQHKIRQPPHPITTGGSNQTVGSSNLPVSV